MVLAYTVLPNQIIDYSYRKTIGDNSTRLAECAVCYIDTSVS
jgi:hypothetical protein